MGVVSRWGTTPVFFSGMRGFRSVLLVAFVLLIAPRLAAQDLPPQLADRFSEGVAALKSGDLTAAETAFRDVLAGGGNRAFVHHNLGIVLDQKERHADALAEFRAATAIDPAFGPAHLMAGNTLLAMGRAADALPELRVAVRLLPDQAIAHAVYADALERTGDIGGVVDEYRRLVTISPSDPDFRYRLGKAYLKLAQWSFERLRAVAPRSARLPQALGQQYLQQGRPDLALQPFEKAAQLDPTLPGVHLMLARIHLDAKRLDQAAREIGLELALVPDSAMAKQVQRQIAAAQGTP